MGPVKHPGGADPAVGQGGGASLPDVEFGRRALREDARIVGEPLSPPVELPYAEAGSDYSESQQAREEHPAGERGHSVRRGSCTRLGDVHHRVMVIVTRKCNWQRSPGSGLVAYISHKVLFQVDG
jgi:hypothetical protein